jgi:hypothetical protein
MRSAQTRTHFPLAVAAAGKEAYAVREGGRLPRGVTTPAGPGPSVPTAKKGQMGRSNSMPLSATLW